MIQVAFVVPVFNAEQHILRFFKCVVSTASNVGFVFVDDGSLDSSRKLLNNLCAQHPNCHLLIAQRNGGQSRARNMGIAHIQKHQKLVSHVGFLDIDDTVSDTFFERMRDLKSDTVYVTDFHSVSAENGETIDEHCDLDDFVTLEGTDYFHLLLKWKATVSSCNKLIPLQATGFYPKNTKEEDTIYAFELAAKNLKFEKLSGATYKYIRHDGSSSDQIDLRFFDLFYVLHKVESLSKNIGISSDEFRRFWLFFVTPHRLKRAGWGTMIVLTLCLLLKSKGPSFEMRSALKIALRGFALKFRK